MDDGGERAGSGVVTAFDEGERRIWSGRAAAYAESVAGLCAFAVPRLLDAAGVGAGTRVLDAGTGPGAAAAEARARGALVAAVDADPGMAVLAAAAAPGVAVAALPRLPFAGGGFDAVVANFVLNHVGRPRAAAAELRRVARPGGLVAVTTWAVPGGAGQELLGRAMRAAGAARPPYPPPLAPEEDFPRDEDGLAGLLGSAGLRDVSCETIRWHHRASPEQWWAGPAAGVGFTGHMLTSQPGNIRAGIRRHFDRLCREFMGPDGTLILPHAALLARGRR